MSDGMVNAKVGQLPEFGTLLNSRTTWIEAVESAVMGEQITATLGHERPSLVSRLVVLIFRKRAKRAPAEQKSALPLSIQPNPAYFVELPATPFRRLVELIQVSDGGVFAVTGVRGAGKSVLLNALTGHFQERYHTLSLASPVGSVGEMDFFMSLFRLLCESVHLRLRKTILREALDLKSVGKREARRQLLLFVAIAALLQVPLLFLVSLQRNAVQKRETFMLAEHALRATDDAERRIGVINEDLQKVQAHRLQNPKYVPDKKLLSDALSTNPDVGALVKASQGLIDDLKTQSRNLNETLRKLRASQSYSRETIANAQAAYVDAAAAISKVYNWGRQTHLIEVMDIAYGSDRVYYDLDHAFGLSESSSFYYAPLDSSTIWFFVFFELISLLGAFWGYRALIRFNRYRKNPAGMGLLIASADLREYLDFELTRSREAEISIPVLKEFSGKIKRSSELKTRSISLPGLTSQYIAYVQQLLQVLPDKLVICIDELDKITDLDNVRAILREIKGGLYVKGCFYVISLSEDVLKAFGERLSSNRDIFESTFDEVFNIGRLDLESCRAVLKRRLLSEGRESEVFVNSKEDILLLCATLSAGIPRDLIRCFRECVLVAQSGASGSPQLCWERLFLQKLSDAKSEILVYQGYDEIRVVLLEELDRLSSEARSSMADLSRILISLDATLASLVSGTSNTSNGTSGTSSTGSPSPLKSWMRDWVELQIYVCTAVVIAAPCGERDRLAEKVRYIYALLPYSLELSRAELQRLISSALGRFLKAHDAPAFS